MPQVTFNGSIVQLEGHLPEQGKKAPDFELVDGNLEKVRLSDFKGKKKLLNIVPSLDTPICIKSTKLFNKSFKGQNNAVCLTISADLPFAQKRFCEAENTFDVKTLSTMNNPNFAKNYGVLINDGSLKGLTTRVLIVLDEEDKVIYSELVPEIMQEPNYDLALSHILPSANNSSCQI